MLTLDKIDFAYGNHKILDSLSLRIKKGEIVSLIGLSGSGKTTLFRLITGLLQPQKGTILIDGLPLPEGAKYITYMRQEDLLLPWRTVSKNLLLFNELGSKPLASISNQLIDTLLTSVGLNGYGNHYPHELSGGQRQRVALSRALLQNRPLFLLDEPFGSLDVVIREQLYSLIKKIQDQKKTTILLVTHDFRDAIALSDRLLVLYDKKIAADIPNKNDPSDKIRHIFSEPPLDREPHKGAASFLHEGSL
ncbi:MAG: ABC transporter ATP-binding protein [Chlamydiia bacterium]|nr:ABC transporter ATP-binding protein [Chlamydiia bacterium]